MARIRFENGQIVADGVQIGTANVDLKNGYHPAVLVQIGVKRGWFELDEADLLAKIADFAREQANK